VDFVEPFCEASRLQTTDTATPMGKEPMGNVSTARGRKEELTNSSCASEDPPSNNSGQVEHQGDGAGLGIKVF
jgi:hypothetical protein